MRVAHERAAREVGTDLDSGGADRQGGERGRDHTPVGLKFNNNEIDYHIL